jgi:ribonuclease P protein component
LFDYVQETANPLQAGVTVSSRNFKKAVQRNRVKRVLREVYRLQKLPLQNALISGQKSLALFFIYTSKTMPVYKEVSEKMEVILQKLQENVIKERKT